MPDNTQARLAKLQKLRKAYTAGLAERLAGIAQCWALVRQSPEDSSNVRELHRQVHSMAGSAGTFGYCRLGQAARNLEKIISEADGLALTEIAQADDIQSRLDGLQLIADSGPEVAEQTELIQMQAPPRADSGRVFLIEDDKAQADETIAQLSAYGWEVSAFGTAEQARKALRKTLPAAVVVDQMLPEGVLAGTDLLRQVKELAEYRIPRVVVSSRRDWLSRLAAAQAGADAYLVKPLDYIVLAETLDQLSYGHDREPYRILIVEDTVELAEHYAHVLGGAGMSVHAINDPSKLLDALTDTKPELILMDLYMPECSGIDAARVIRQDPEYLSVPIVFLSSEAGRDRQLAAMKIGADDFLEKPIDDEQLIAAVQIRADRFRSLAAQIHQDSLTGLLNHISFKLQLETEISRSSRAGSSLTFAMLDIDHFKRINDSYGHPVGDRVIRSMATLLTKRLRKSDLIGRYGGEEYAVLMSDTKLDAGLAVLNEIREQFANIVYISNGEEFSCTVSIGVASTADYTTMDALIQAADSALYEAKRSGRNRICTAMAHYHDPRKSGYGSKAS